MADVGHELLPRALQLLDAREIVKDEDGPVLGAVAVEHGGGADLHPSFPHSGQLEAMALHGALLLEMFHEVGELREAKSFNHRLAADVGLQREEPLQRLVDKLNAAR